MRHFIPEPSAGAVASLSMDIHRLADAADLLGVSDDTLRRWQQQGRFTAVEADGGRAGATQVGASASGADRVRSQACPIRASLKIWGP